MLETRLGFPELPGASVRGGWTSRTKCKSSETTDSLQVGTIVMLTGLGSMMVFSGAFMCLFRVCGRL